MLGFIINAAPSLASGPVKGERQKLVYEVYAGGIHAVQAILSIDLNEEKKRYNIVLDTHTRGFLGSLVPWKGRFESRGWIHENQSLQTEQHKSTTSWSDEVDIKDYLYNKDGSFKSLRITDEHSDNELREVEKELTDQTTDILSATLSVMRNYSTEQKCEGASEVFDGKRRYKLEYQHQGAPLLKSSKYNIYGGRSAECVVEVTPIAGAWHKKPRGWLSIQEQGRKRGMMPTVWLGKVGDSDVAVPVKIRVKTAYGTLFMHLAEFSVNDKEALVAEERHRE